MTTEVPMIADLSEEDRKLALQETEELLKMLKQCECYLRDYAAGTQNLYKFFGVVFYTRATLAEVCDELARIHGLGKNPLV